LFNFSNQLMIFQDIMPFRYFWAYHWWK